MFFNISRDMLGIGAEEGRIAQVSSYGHRTKVLPGIPGEFMRKCVDIAPGEEFTMADLAGPGLVTRLWVTMPRRTNPGVLRNVVLRMYWDDEESPSVLTPLGDLFSTSFSRPAPFASAWLAISSGAFLSHFPMPFGTRALVTAENQGPMKIRLFFYQLTYLRLEKPLPDELPRFHCHWHREAMERGSAPFSILDTRGRGFYMGCHLDMQGAGWPWRPNPLHVQMPEGFGLGMLEGWERIWLDGEHEPSVHGTGGEDYFNGAWYFTKVPVTTLTHGVTVRSYATRRVSCYRFHAEMPVRFADGIRVTLDHGINNRLPARYDATTYWYQEEPHEPLAEPPPPADRRPSGKLRNLAVMASPAAGALLGAALSKRLRSP